MADMKNKHTRLVGFSRFHFIGFGCQNYNIAAPTQPVITNKLAGGGQQSTLKPTNTALAPP